MDSPPLTAEQVFLIADPPITLKTLADLAIPSVKVDLKARLAIELNRKLLQSTGEAREIIRKRLKKLYLDESSVDEQRNTLNLIKGFKKNREPELEKMKILIERKMTRLNEEIIQEPLRVEADIENLTSEGAIKNRRKKLKAYIDLRQDSITRNEIKILKINGELAGTDNNQLLEGIITRMEFLDSQGKKRDEYLQNKLSKKQRNAEMKLKKIDAAEYNELYDRKAEEIAKIQNKPMKLADEKKKLGESIVQLSDKQRELEELEVINLTQKSDINPAAYEKTLSERVAESNELFQNLLNGGRDPHITLPFEAFAQYDNINQVFVEPESGRITNMVLIIYRSAENFGHWCCLTRSNDLQKITYFNSYGSYIDKALDYIPTQFADISKQNFPHLLKLLSESDYQIHWNDTQLQAMNKRISTCGNWAGLFMHYSRLGKSIEEFVAPFLTVPLEERDDLILKLTAPYLIG